MRPVGFDNQISPRGGLYFNFNFNFNYSNLTIDDRVVDDRVVE